MQRQPLPTAMALALAVAGLSSSLLLGCSAQSHAGHDHSHHDPSSSDLASSHSSPSSHSMSHDSMSMPMYFVPRATGPLLFSWADVTGTGAYLLFALAVALACLTRELLSTWRMQVETINSQLAQLRSSPLPSPDSSGARIDPHRYAGSSLLSAPVLSSLLYALNMMLAYLIMLVVMSYDAFYFAVIICSSGAAHYYLHHYRATGEGSPSHSSGRGRMVNDDESGGGGRFGRDDSVSPPPHMHPVSTAMAQGRGKTPNKSPNPAKTAAATLLAVTKDCCES